jgi:hypothetical protein
MKVKPKQKSSSPQFLVSTWSLVAVVCVVILLAMIRVRVADVPLERDEGEYAYAGQLILQGYPPYQLAYNMKFPGTYYAYGLIMAAFGQTPWGIHIGLLIVNAATVFLLFFWGRRLLGDPKAAAIGAIAFAVLSVDRWINGVFGHATHFVVIAAVAGLLMLWKALESNKARTFVLSGVLLGLAVLMKQNGIFFLVLGVGIAVLSGSQQSQRFRSGITQAALVSLGSFIPFAVLVLVLFFQGTLHNFWFWTVQYAKEYATQTSFAEAHELLTGVLTYITKSDLQIWLLGCAGAVLLWIVPWPRQSRMFLTALAGASVLSVCPGLYFRPHYFILLLPAVGLLCGVAAVSIERLLQRVLSKSVASTVTMAICIIVIGSYFATNTDYLFSVTPRELSRVVYGANPFVEAPEIARYITEHTTTADRIAVLGSEPEIYFYANRKSATGYIYMYPLMEMQKYSDTMQDEMIREITAVHPKYIVYTLIPSSWLVRNPKERVLRWVLPYVNQCYTLTGVAELLSNGQTRWFWDTDVFRYQKQTENVIYVSKAKSDQPCSVNE